MRGCNSKETDKDHIGWELVDEEKNVWSFDKYGVLRFVTDRLGFQTTFDYDENYALTKITLPSGKAFAFEQDARGFVTNVTRPDGGKLAYEYDENHRHVRLRLGRTAGGVGGSIG